MNCTNCPYWWTENGETYCHYDGLDGGAPCQDCDLPECDPGLDTNTEMVTEAQTFDAIDMIVTYGNKRLRRCLRRHGLRLPEITENVYNHAVQLYQLSDAIEYATMNGQAFHQDVTKWSRSYRQHNRSLIKLIRNAHRNRR